MEASNATLYSRNLIGDNLPTGDNERNLIRNKALNHPDYPYLFLSKNGLFGGILLRTDFNSEIVVQNTETQSQKITKNFDDDDEFAEDDKCASFGGIAETMEFKRTDMTEYSVLLNALRKLIQKKEYNDALVFHPVGKPVLMDFFAEAVLKDLGRIMGLVLLLIIIMLWVLFRSFSAVLWPLVIIITTLIWVTGIIGWSGVHMSIMFQIIIFLILAVGIADSVHIMSGYLFFRNNNYHHKKALTAVMKKSGLACLLTSTTTAAGLLSLSLVPIKPIIIFGLFSSIGVLTAFILTVFLMPLMLDLWNNVPKKTKGKNHLIQRIIRKTENTGPRNSGVIIIIFTVLGVFFFIGLMKLRIEALAFKKDIQNYIDLNFKSLKENYPDYEIKLTGNMVLVAVMLDYISWAEIKSFGLTLLVISGILFIVFGNFKAGVIAIIPNIFPIITSFGIMGFLNIPLDMDTLLIAPVIIGLAVDDTIHFLTHYKLEVEKTGDIKEAAINSMREAGQAICFTSLILAAGFFMFVLSFHNGLSHFGIFSAIAILTAFIADIYLLPALCVFFKVDFKKADFPQKIFRRSCRESNF